MQQTVMGPVASADPVSVPPLLLQVPGVNAVPEFLIAIQLPGTQNVEDASDEIVWVTLDPVHVLL